MSHIAISFLVLGGVVVLFVWNRIPVEFVAVGAAITLYATGVLTLNESLAGFGDPSVLFIAALFVISEALDASGVTAWAGRELVARAGGNRRRLLVLTMLLVAVLTAFISVNGAVAALLPVVVVMAIRLNWSPSQMLLPMVFAAHAGSMLALTGTPVSVVVSQAAADAGVGRFGYFDFTLVGIPLVVGAVAIVLLLGDRLVPQRTPRVMPADFSEHARVLVDQYLREDQAVAQPMYTYEGGVAEVVIPPRSGLIGEVAFPGMVTDSGTLVVLAVQRSGVDHDGQTVLEAGDTLLLQGSWSAFADNLDDPDVLVVDEPDLVRRQIAPMGRRGRVAAAVLAGMVVLLATGATAPVVAGLLAAMAMVLLRVISLAEAYRGISWTTVILVGGMIPLSTAMRQSGAAEKLAHGLVDVVGDASPYLLVFGLCLLTAALGQLISNMATALIVIPIAVSAAADVGVSARPLLMAVNVAAAASFITPVATPVNLMIKEPGGYKFGDYWKLGLPFMALFLVVATFLVPVFWPF
jgi:di/tricarboxylate transporter